MEQMTLEQLKSLAATQVVIRGEVRISRSGVHAVSFNFWLIVYENGVWTMSKIRWESHIPTSEFVVQQFNDHTMTTIIGAWTNHPWNATGPKVIHCLTSFEGGERVLAEASPAGLLIFGRVLGILSQVVSGNPPEVAALETTLHRFQMLTEQLTEQVYATTGIQPVVTRPHRLKTD